MGNGLVGICFTVTTMPEETAFPEQKEGSPLRGSGSCSLLNAVADDVEGEGAASGGEKATLRNAAAALETVLSAGVRWLEAWTDEILPMDAKMPKSQSQPLKDDMHDKTNIAKCTQHLEKRR
jgi:hypothetical protein